MAVYDDPNERSLVEYCLTVDVLGAAQPRYVTDDPMLYLDSDRTLALSDGTEILLPMHGFVSSSFSNQLLLNLLSVASLGCLGVVQAPSLNDVVLNRLRDEPLLNLHTIICHPCHLEEYRLQVSDPSFNPVPFDEPNLFTFLFRGQTHRLLLLESCGESVAFALSHQTEVGVLAVGSGFSMRPESLFGIGVFPNRIMRIDFQ